jgi:UDP-glucose 6-dehydrogenase
MNVAIVGTGYVGLVTGVCLAERAIVALKDLYEPFLQPGSKVIEMDEKSAEVTKYAANAFLYHSIGRKAHEGHGPDGTAEQGRS